MRAVRESVSVGEAAALGAVQGLTEFLPVSSSAHLALLRRALGHEGLPRAFDVALHLGTAAALLTALWRDLIPPAWALAVDIARHGPRPTRYRPAARFALELALANIPAIAAGALAHREIEDLAARPRTTALALIAGSLVLAAAETLPPHPTPIRNVRAIGPWRALALGCAQAAALLPGVSRSGATITAGMALGLERGTAARYSALLGTPAMLAAATHALPALPRLLRRTGPRPLAAAVATSTLTGTVSIALLARTITRSGPRAFVPYRLALAILIWRLFPDHAAPPPAPRRR